MISEEGAPLQTKLYPPQTIAMRRMRRTRGMYRMHRVWAVFFVAALLLFLLPAGGALAAKTPKQAEAEKAALASASEATPSEGAAEPGATPAPASPSEEEESGAQKKDAAESSRHNFLLLVNWDNPYYGGSFELVRLDKVIDKGLVAMKNHHQIDKTAGAAANAMFRAAKEEGVGKLVIDNAYRSVERQETMWKKRLRRNKNYGANPYQEPVKVLPGGKSEHATGLALDIFAKSYQKSNAAFGNTAEGRWLAQNAHKYGFILRYPADKQHITGVVYEPWHFRYVGVAPATEMYEQRLCLEEYLKK